MKKFLVTILALVYLTTSIGATVHFHFCMDKLVAWGLGSGKSKSKACPYCGMVKTSADKHCGKQSKGCCHDEHKQVKVEKDQKVVDAGFKLERPLLVIADHTLPGELSSIAVFSPSIEYPLTHAPPRTDKAPLFVRNCVFRI
ncbi:MAG: hypothetical protein JST09_18895 [Bacteroidetes bacterium]|nr:hypothetical protein [Pseudomonadota bacterium]MBS1577372.1 hypothetical protein [Bacteroidota bacterium]